MALLGEWTVAADQCWCSERRRVRLRKPDTSAVSGNRQRPQNQRLDLGAGGAAHVFGLGAEAGDLGAGGLDSVPR